MYRAKIVSPTGDEYIISAPIEWELHQKVKNLVGRINVRNVSTTTLRGGHTLIKGGGWSIILYCSGK